MSHDSRSTPLTDPARWRRRRSGGREAGALVAVALLTAAVFANGALDIAVARWFYSPDLADHWPLARQFPWALLYRAASLITASLVIAGLAALSVSLSAARRHWRQPAVLVLLAVAIGPGLLGNALFKDHWQHPRPRDLVEFGGPQHYVLSPLIGHEGGASFPCGHCTVGFLYGSGWWIWRRRRPAWAVASLAAGLAVGLLLGIGRLAAGAHFLSDIIWSALLAFGVLHLLYYQVLHIAAGSPAAATAADANAPAADARAERPAPRGVTITVTLAALAGSVAVLIAVFAAPHGTQLTARVPLTASSPRVLEIEADSANIAIVLLDAPSSELTIDGELHGFGLPGSRLDAHLERVAGPRPALRYRIEDHGWLTDVDGAAQLRVPASRFERILVSVHRGNIRISDMTRARVLRAKTLRLELHTDHGRILSLP